VDVDRALGLLLIAAGAIVAKGSAPPRSSPDASDLDAAARMIVVELGGGGSPEELSGMVWAALNRATAWGASLADVIYSRVPNRARWGGVPSTYNAALDRVDPSSAAYRRAAAVARGVLSGQVASPIGPRRAFVHPLNRAFDSPSQARPIGVSVRGRVRYLPTWSVSRADGGAASHEPIDVGSTPTRFS